jgi:NitT/TauT family transport system permease protein
MTIFGSEKKSPARAQKRELSPFAIRALSIGSFLIFWEIFGRRVDPILMSYPSAIVVAFWEMLQSGELATESGRSIRAFLAGFGLAIIFGVLIGIAMGVNRRFEYAVDPFINALYSTPNVALIPLIILWLGLGLTAKIAIVFLIAFFPIVVSTFAGVKNVSGALVEIGRAFGLNGVQILRKIILPGSVPFIATGIRLAVGRAVVGMVVAEFFTAISGLGGMIIKYSNKFETDRMFVPIIVLAIFGVVLTEFVKVLERYLAPWKETERLQL